MNDSDEEYRLLFDTNPRPMWVFDRETLCFIEVNRAACEHYEWSRDEFLAMTLHDIRRPEDRPQLERFVAVNASETAVTYWRTARHITKSGRTMAVDLTLTRLVFRGRPSSLCVVTDVTGVSEAERRFRLLVENSVDGITLVGEDGIVNYMSPGAERLFGLEKGALIGTRARANMHPDDVPVARPPSPGETMIVTNRARHTDGSWRWIESVATNLTHDPAVRAMVANSRDVTERHDAEEARRRSEEHFRRVIERLPTATFIHRDGRYLYVNPAAVVMLGYDGPEQLIGRPVVDFVHPDDRDFIRSRQSTHGADSVPRAEARMIRRDGTTVICEAEGVVLDFDGKPALISVAHDVTERKELFAKVALADRLLSVGTLAAGVAHEINNPLAYVTSNLALLANELPKLLAGDRSSRFEPAELEAMLADAREGAARVSAIVRDLRALSRPEDNRQTAVDVGAALAQSIKMANNEIRHRARVVATVDPELPLAAGNASRLGQVFLNLLINAAHAIVPGHADTNEIRIRAHADAEHVIVEIEDTGVGIPPALVDRIFDPFFTTKPAGVGIGLGLAICHEIIRSVGGTIQVSGAVGVGTTFRVAVPLARAVAPVPERRVVASPTGRARVLLIDDEDAVGRSMRHLLEPKLDVVVVTRARAGLDCLEAGERFDVILCDLMMPEMSGVELHAELKRSWPQYVPRLVFMTGGAFSQDAQDLLATLKNPCLEKPFSEQELHDAIATLLGS